MHVTHVNHVDTHAVIGGQAAQAFAITQNAEFFEVLSSTLYSNKKLAVVREVLCNAWDAHLMVGKTDTAVEVTLTDKELVIRDFGPGIAPEKIIDIYCTYGNSTKTHDGKQTGGFGLGSKAPFAYAKHFTVVSCFNGKRSVYAASRGSSETEGRPDMRCMVAVPTDETGLTVTIPIQSEDKDDFRRLIQDLTFGGGMKVNLDGKELQRIDYSIADFCFVYAPPRSLGRHHDSGEGVFVRYGAVAYETSFSDPRLEAAYRSVGRVAALARSGAFVLLAEPNSMGVTPSRESLSYTDKTVDALIALLQKAEEQLKVVQTKMRPGYNAELTKIVRETEYDPLALMAQCIGCNDLTDWIRSELVRNRSSVWNTGTKFYVASEEKLVKFIAKACVRNYGYGYVNKAFKTDRETETFRASCIKALRGRFPHLKVAFNRIENGVRSLRRFRSGQMHNYVLDFSGLKTEINRRMERLIARVEADFKVKLVFGGFSYDSFNESELFSQCLNHRSSGAFVMTQRQLNETIPVIVSPSRAAAQRLVRKSRRNSAKELRNKAAILLLTRKASDIEGALQFMQTAGFTWNEDASSEVIQRVVMPATEQLHMLAPVQTDDKGCYALLEAPKFTGKAKFYVYGDTRETCGGTVVVSEASCLPVTLQDLLTKRYPGQIAVAHHATDARRLEKEGVQNVFKVMADEMRAFISESDANLCTMIMALKKFDDLSDEMPSLLTSLDDGEKLRLVSKVDPSVPAEMVPIGQFDLHLRIMKNGHYNSATSKYGFQHFSTLVKDIGEQAKTRFKPLLDFLEHKDVKTVFGAIYGWRWSESNKAITTTITNALFESAAVQIKLEAMESSK